MPLLLTLHAGVQRRRLEAYCNNASINTANNKKGNYIS